MCNEVSFAFNFAIFYVCLFLVTSNGNLNHANFISSCLFSKKNRFSCWEHILGKILSHLFVFILFRVFICGFLDFIIASFSLLVGFIFFICGCYLIQFFILFCCHCTFPSFQKKHVFHIHHTCSGKQFLTVSFRSVMEKQWQRDSQFNRSKHLFIYPERKKFDGALLRWSELLTAKHLAEHS